MTTLKLPLTLFRFYSPDLTDVGYGLTKAAARDHAYDKHTRQDPALAEAFAAACYERIVVRTTQDLMDLLQQAEGYDNETGRHPLE